MPFAESPGPVLATVVLGCKTVLFSTGERGVNIERSKCRTVMEGNQAQQQVAASGARI